MHKICKIPLGNNRIVSMLLSLSVSNFRSYGDEAVLDLQRRGFKTQRPRNGETWIENTWRRAAIFGANAAGKSNVLRALGQINNAVKFSLRADEFLKVLRNPHMLREKEVTSFELEYVYDDIRYRWGLVLDRVGVVEEYLDANQTSRWRKVYQRNRAEISFGNDIGISHAAKENIEEFLRPWVLVLSAWGTLRSTGKFGGAVAWWKGVLPLIVSSDADQDTRHKWMVNLARQDPNWLKVLKLVVNVADVGISDIGIEELAPESVRQIFVKFNDEGGAEVSENLNPDEINEVLRYLLFKHHAHGESFSLSEHEESQGTRTWMDIVVPAVYALAVGGVMVIDEIDGSLHPALVRELVSYFESEELNARGAQLLFSTHDLTLLGKYPTEVLNRGEVWFVEKSGSYSELIALDEFPVRSAHNIEKRYLQGQYGAVPNVYRSDLGAMLEKIRHNFQTGQLRE